MSSQLLEMMKTDKYATVQQTMDALRIKLAMPAGNIMSTDYIAGQNLAMHTAAQNMASIMGGQMSPLLGGSGTATIVDVSRYLGMTGAIFSSISSIIKGTNSQGTMTNLMGTMP